MQISVTGRRVEVTDAIRTYGEQKASKLLKYYDRIQSIEIVLDYEATQHKVEVIVEAEHRNTFVARESSEDMYAALDLVIDKLERQITKHKERYRNRKHLAKGVKKTTED